MSIRVVKECLIAAVDLDMIGGDYVFLAFEIDIAGGTARQQMTFKWATADYGNFDYDGNSNMQRYTHARIYIHQGSHSPFRSSYFPSFNFSLANSIFSLLTI